MTVLDFIYTFEGGSSRIHLIDHEGDPLAPVHSLEDTPEALWDYKVTSWMLLHSPFPPEDFAIAARVRKPSDD